MGSRVGIVGAGLAGVGVAHALTRETGGELSEIDDTLAQIDTTLETFDNEVTILEKSRGVGGRAATRRRETDRYYYDHGANYVKEADERTVALVRSLGENGLVTVTEPVWPFAGDGTISESERDPEPKFTWETGITQFAKRLLADADATVHKTTRVAGASFDEEGWTIRDTAGGRHGPFDAVVYTPPAPQTADLLADTTSETSTAAGETTLTATITALRERVADVSFRTTRTVVLGYEEPLDRPWYALVNTDGDHAIGWLAREECKNGHVPDGESVLIVQMAPDYSERTYDDAGDEVAADAADRVARLLDEPRLSDPAWTDDQGWRYAQPDETLVDAPARDRAERAGLFLAGDWLVPEGKGRVHEAYWQGVRVAARLADRLDAN